MSDKLSLVVRPGGEIVVDGVISPRGKIVVDDVISPRGKIVVDGMTRPGMEFGANGAKSVETD